MATITFHCPACGQDIDYNVTALGIGEYVGGEEATGVKDGTNDTFTTEYAFIPGSEQVVVNQLVKKRTDDDVPTGVSKQIGFVAGSIPPFGCGYRHKLPNGMRC